MLPFFYTVDLQERAAKNNLFVYVKIPEVLMKVSYKVIKWFICVTCTACKRRNCSSYNL